MAYSTTASATQTYNRSKHKPHDKLPMRVVKATLNCAAGAIAATAQSVNVATIPAGSMVLAVNIDVTTAEGADVGIDVGLSEGDEFGDDVNAAVATQSTMLGVPYLCVAANKVTVKTDGGGLANAIIDIYTCYVEFDSLTAVN